MKLQENNQENFINYWQFLEIPMNSPLGDIKFAFVNKFNAIKASIARGEDNYLPEHLNICVKAYETLSDPYSRFLHNCEIDGEEPPKAPDWDAFIGTDDQYDEDLPEEVNESFHQWLLSIANELKTQVGTYIEIANKLYVLFIKEKEKQERKELGQKKLKAMHK